MNHKAILALFLMHFTGDFYQSFFMPLLPVLKENMNLSLTQIGLITGVVTIASFVTQPLTGHLADRCDPRPFLLAGLALSIFFIPLISLAQWFALVLVITGLGAFGSSLSHPTAAAMVSVYAKERTGLAMSIFGIGGTLAHSIGPLVVTIYISTFGFSRLSWLSIFGVILFSVLYFLLPKTDIAEGFKPDQKALSRPGFGILWKHILALWLICALRALLDISLKSFYPILHVAKGNSLVSAGLVLSLYMLGGTVGALSAGHLVDKQGYRKLFVYSFSLSMPSVLLFLWAPGLWLYPSAFLTGLANLATMFPAIALATKIAPNNKALASSLVFGFAIGTGSLMAPAVGRLAESFGIQNVLTALAILPLICLALTPAATKE